MDYTYKVGDKVYLKDWADSRYNTVNNRGKEVTIIGIDKHDPFIPYHIKTFTGFTYWIDSSAIESYANLLGLRI